MNFLSFCSHLSARKFVQVTSPMIRRKPKRFRLNPFSNYGGHPATQTRNITSYGAFDWPIAGLCKNERKRKIHSKKLLLLSSEVDEVGSHTIFLAPAKLVHAESLKWAELDSGLIF